MGTKSRLRRVIADLASSEADRDDEVLQEAAAECGAVPVCNCQDRELVTLAGTLRTLTYAPRGGVPALEGELYDGSSAIQVVWLGRRRIAGIRPGVNIRVTGRVGKVDGQKVVFNPKYELQPDPRVA